MKVIIAGGRDFIPEPKDIITLATLDNEHVFDEIVCGEARGADTFGKEYGKIMGIHIESFPADWNNYGKKAGPIRNEEMACYADAVIFFPGGKGTEDMRRRALKRGLKILYDGGNIGSKEKKEL